jgi:hypothetical protein
MPGYTD